MRGRTVVASDSRIGEVTRGPFHPWSGVWSWRWAGDMAGWRERAVWTIGAHWLDHGHLVVFSVRISRYSGSVVWPHQLSTPAGDAREHRLRSASAPPHPHVTARWQVVVIGGLMLDTPLCVRTTRWAGSGAWVYIRSARCATLLGPGTVRTSLAESTRLHSRLRIRVRLCRGTYTGRDQPSQASFSLEGETPVI